MKKYTYPPFLTMLATTIAMLIHKITGFHVDIELATAAIAIVGNYLIMQFASDIQKIRRGEVPTGSFNSLKLITAAIICVILGISNYLQLDFTIEQIIVFVGMAMTVITGKGVKDIMTTNHTEARKEVMSYEVAVTTELNKPTEYRSNK